MFDYIGEKIRADVLANLTWISRSAGFTTPVRVEDNGRVRLFPGARPYAGVACEDGDYINMGPDAGQVGIAFVDSESSLQVSRKTSKYSEIEALFRVVVWYDERKITVPGSSAMIGLQSAIIAGVRALSFNTDGLYLTKTYFQRFDHNAGRIWSRYGIVDNDAGLFIAPYQTFAVNFRMIGRYIPECFTGEITADASAC